MTVSPVQLGGLALIFAVLAFGQRLGGWENPKLGRLFGFIAASLGVSWCFLFLPPPFDWVVTLVISWICLWYVYGWIYQPPREIGTDTTTETFHATTNNSAPGPGWRVPEITGEFWDLRVASTGRMTANQQHWIRCELRMQVSLSLSGQQQVRIEKMYMGTYLNTPACRTLSTVGPPRVSTLEPDTSHSFSFKDDIEFIDDGSNHLPSSLHIIVIDQFGGKHSIFHRDGGGLPEVQIARK
jgi:hypothetical protein